VGRSKLQREALKRGGSDYPKVVEPATRWHCDPAGCVGSNGEMVMPFGRLAFSPLHMPEECSVQK
jgi:hypothetical protein